MLAAPCWGLGILKGAEEWSQWGREEGAGRGAHQLGKGRVVRNISDLNHFSCQNLYAIRANYSLNPRISNMFLLPLGLNDNPSSSAYL